MNNVVRKNYSTDVSINIVKGFFVLGSLSAIFGVFLLGALFLFDGSIDATTKQQLEWCEQYQPTLSFSDCSIEAGW